jgi:uncharacterized membrane protein YdcZ (DUF606 family)
MNSLPKDLVYWTSFCAGCFLVGAIVATVISVSVAPKSEISWWTICFGAAAGQFVNNGVIFPAVKRLVAKRKEAADR